MDEKADPHLTNLLGSNTQCPEVDLVR